MLMSGSFVTIEPTLRERFVGCLLGGAIGDALGAPVEFLSSSEIEEQFGSNGVRRFAPAYGGHGKVTDDTQMTLFTAEGLLRAEQRRGEAPWVLPTSLERYIVHIFAGSLRNFRTRAAFRGTQMKARTCRAGCSSSDFCTLIGRQAPRV
jgi:hypothetical protein